MQNSISPFLRSYYYHNHRLRGEGRRRRWTDMKAAALNLNYLWHISPPFSPSFSMVPFSLFSPSWGFAPTFLCSCLIFRLHSCYQAPGINMLHKRARERKGEPVCCEGQKKEKGAEGGSRCIFFWGEREKQKKGWRNGAVNVKKIPSLLFFLFCNSAKFL